MNVHQRNTEVNHHRGESSCSIGAQCMMIALDMCEKHFPLPIFDAKQGFWSDDLPVSIPVRQLSQHHNKSDSTDSFNGVLFEFAATKFVAAECGKPPNLPLRPLTNQYMRVESTDSYNSFLSPSTRFAAPKCDEPLRFPQHPQGIIGMMLNESYTTSSFFDLQEPARGIDADTELTQQDFTVHIGSNIEKGTIDNKDIDRERKYVALDYQDQPLHRPMRQISKDVGSMLLESPAVDNFGLSTRFSKADFEAPIYVPLRQQSLHFRSGSIESLTDNESLGSFEFEFGEE